MNVLKNCVYALMVSVCLVPIQASAGEGIKFGLIATFEGPLTELGADAERGVNTAIDEASSKVAGNTIEIVKSSSDGSPDSAVRAARKLVEQDGIKIIIGPLSGDEGIALKDYAKTKPEVTFLNGTSAAQDTTLRDPADNFFRFNTDGAQWMAGLGSYVFNEKKFKRVAVVAEDYSFPYTQVFGFMAEFCKAGGHVPSKSWVPLGNKDFSSVIAAIPDDVDAIFVALAGADAINFLNQYQQSGGTAPLIGGSNTVDQTVLSSKGKTRQIVVGMPSASPTADTNDTPEWQAFVKSYSKQPGAYPAPSIAAFGYYVNTRAALLALEQVSGNLDDGGAKLRQSLKALSFDAPSGKIALDSNRNAIANNYVTEVAEGSDGNLYNKLITVVPQVNQQLGLTNADFNSLGSVGRDNPSCL